LCDAFQVPKPLSLQLLPFGKYDDDLGELTFGVGLFSVLSVPSGRSARVWRTVRVISVLRVFFVFLLDFAFDPRCFRVLVGRSFGRSACAGQTVRGCLDDSPRAPRGRSVIRGASLVVLCTLSDGPRRRAGQSAVLVQTVRGSRPDGPRGQCGRSTPPGRMVHQSLCALLLGSIPSFLSCASACASRNRS
jgi:hypothetical protein